VLQPNLNLDAKFLLIGASIQREHLLHRRLTHPAKSQHREKPSVLPSRTYMHLIYSRKGMISVLLSFLFFLRIANSRQCRKETKLKIVIKRINWTG
jgi:hypothetical protein